MSTYFCITFGILVSKLQFSIIRCVSKKKCLKDFHLDHIFQILQENINFGNSCLIVINSA